MFWLIRAGCTRWGLYGKWHNDGVKKIPAGAGQEFKILVVRAS